MYRPTLLRILADHAVRHGARIDRGVTASAIEDVEGDVMVTFTDGAQRKYDMVIGADGIGSRTRSMLFPDAPKPAYAGQISIRWMIDSPPIEGEGWYIGPEGRLGWYRLPDDKVYVPSVINMPQWKRMSDEEVFDLYTQLIGSYSAPAVLELKSHLNRQSDLICRPFEWILLDQPWHRGRSLLIGDAAHATTAHMGMGGGMALEDAVVLGQCIAAAATLPEAFDAFMKRRFERVRIVVETSVALSRLELDDAPPSANMALMSKAFAAIGEPY